MATREPTPSSGTIGVMPFGSDLPKLDHPVFPTIRRDDKFGALGDRITVRIEETGEERVAEVIAKEHRRFQDLSTEFLRYDTNEPSRENAHGSLNSYYPDDPVEPKDTVTVYVLQWIDERDRRPEPGHVELNPYHVGLLFLVGVVAGAALGGLNTLGVIPGYFVGGILGLVVTLIYNRYRTPEGGDR